MKDVTYDTIQHNVRINFHLKIKYNIGKHSPECNSNNSCFPEDNKSLHHRTFWENQYQFIRGNFYDIQYLYQDINISCKIPINMIVSEDSLIRFVTKTHQLFIPDSLPMYQISARLQQKHWWVITHMTVLLDSMQVYWMTKKQLGHAVPVGWRFVIIGTRART